MNRLGRVIPLLPILAVLGAFGGMLITNAVGIIGFQATPYIRAGEFLFCAPAVVSGLLGLKLRKLDISSSGAGHYFLSLVLLSIFGLPVAVAGGNPATYILTDVTYYVFSFTLFSAAYRYMSACGVEGALKYLKISVIASILLIFGGRLLGLGAPFPVNILVLVGLYLFSLKSDGNFSKAVFLMSLAAIALLVPSSDRSYIICLFACLIIFGLNANNSPLFRTAFVLIAPVIIAVALFVAFETSLLTGTSIGSRITEIKAVTGGGGVTSDISSYERLYEFRQVSKRVEENFYNIIVGDGPGATVDLSQSPDPAISGSALLSATDVHNIHILLGAILLRFGLLGVILTYFLTLFLYRLNRNVFFKVGRSKIHYLNLENRLLVVSALYIDSLIIYSLAASSFLFTDALFPMFAGYATAILSRREESNGSNPSITIATSRPDI